MADNKKKRISIEVNEKTWRDFSVLCVKRDIDKKDMLQSILDKVIEKERKEGNI